MDEPIRRHVLDSLWIRDELLGMDRMINPVMGISDFDDAVCVKFNGGLLASTDGPYDKRLVMKSALVHAATDVVVKGGKPLFALDNLHGSKKDAQDMLSSLRRQAEYMGIPLIGGNTKIADVKATACVTVVGRLLLDAPIRDCGAKKGDVIALFGEPIWGEEDERLMKAKKMFNAWFKALKNVKINSSKDVTKGGLVSSAYEMQTKSGQSFSISSYPYHRTRNLDNFLLTLDEGDASRLERICSREGVAFHRIGAVT